MLGRFIQNPVLSGVSKALARVAAALVVAWAVPAHGQPSPYVEGEVLVRFKKSVSAKRARDAAVARGLSVSRTYPSLSARKGRAYLHCRSGKTTVELLAELGRHPLVDVAVPNYLKTVYAPSFPTDPDFTNLWGLRNTGQTVEGNAGTSDADIDYPEAWELSRASDASEVIVAVIDTGVDYNHPDLAANVWTNPGEDPTNGVDDDANGYVDDYYGYDFAGDLDRPPDPDPMDVDTEPGHGTHVSGTTAAVRDNGHGIVGVHHGARIMALKASSDGFTLPDAASIAAIEYAIMMKANGFNIVAINASYGGDSPSVLESDAIEAAGNVGIVFCAAAGNDGTDNDLFSHYPSNYDLSNIISVAATDSDDDLASFSNYGSDTVDLAAPGVDTYSTIPVHINSDAFVEYGASNWTAGGMTYSGITPGITGTVYDCGFGHATSFPVSVSGNIALIQRGPTNPPDTALEFTTKASNAVVAGATAAVIYNHSPGDNFGTLQYPRNWIPVVSLSREDGQALLAQGAVTATVVNRYDPDGAYGFSDGTSMATPHVSGSVAFMALNYPNDSVTQRIARLLSNVDPSSPPLSNRLVTGGRLNIANPMDTDSDTLPDWWELDIATNLSQVNPTTDTDHDGFLDGDEYAAGTGGGNSNDFLEVRTDGTSLTNALVVRWSSVTNRSYSLLRSAALMDGFTTNATGITATAPENVYTDSTATLPGTFLYRIKLDED